MRKFIASTIMVIILTGTIVFLLSSCSLFVNQNHRAATKENFAGHLVFKSIEANPVSAESHYLMGCNFQKKKKHGWAIEEFQAAVSNNPAYVEAYNRLGVSYDLIGDFDKAMAAYRAALNVNPDIDYVHNNMGYSYLLQRRYDLAVSSFQKALALNPENARYRNNLATAYVKSGQETEALTAFKTGNDDAKANMNVARVYYRDGEYAKAEVYYKKAAQSKPKDSLIKKELAAAGSLAEIHAARKTVAPDNQKKASESTQVVASHYDKEGYYTVPAQPVEDFDSADTVAVHISDTNFNEAVAAVEMDYTIVASAPENDLIEKPLAPTEPLLLSRLQPVDESKVQELLHSNLNDLDDNPQKRIKIEVSNGNGVRHMAKQVGHFLKEQNVIIMYLSNADHFNYHDTSIFYTKGNLREALRLSQKLPGRQEIQEVAEIRKGNADISVLIGKDLVPHLDALKES